MKGIKPFDLRPTPTSTTSQGTRRVQTRHADRSRHSSFREVVSGVLQKIKGRQASVQLDAPLSLGSVPLLTGNRSV